MIKKILIIFLVNIVYINLSFCKIVKLKIGILGDVKHFNLALDGSKELFIKLSSGKIKQYKLKKSVKVVYVGSNKIKMLNKIFKLPIVLGSSGKIKIDKEVYDGEVEVSTTKRKNVKLINILSLEQYLYGVLPYEVERSWTDEMLKLQSIIARTYTLANLGRHKNDGYDFCSKMHCQVYRGINKETFQRDKQIVDSTQGLVVCDKNNNLIQTYYHSTCGGEIEDVKEVWNVMPEVKYLKHKKCSYCKNSPYYQWEYVISKEKLQKVLVEKKVNLEKISSINVVSKTSTGRVKQIQIVSKKKIITIPAGTFCDIVGFKNLKSTKLDEIKFLNGDVYFKGRGWGHGIGLCQWGANQMTVSGKKLKDVIKYYYPGTKIKKY